MSCECCEYDYCSRFNFLELPLSLLNDRTPRAAWLVDRRTITVIVFDADVRAGGRHRNMEAFGSGLGGEACRLNSRSGNAHSRHLLVDKFRTFSGPGMAYCHPLRHVNGMHS